MKDGNIRMSEIDLEKEFAKALDEEVGLEFAKQYDFTEDQISTARKDMKDRGISFTTAILDARVILEIFKEIEKER